MSQSSFEFDTFSIIHKINNEIEKADQKDL